jgi:uncharacterized membrane protein YkvA (DUF1232 family)
MRYEQLITMMGETKLSPEKLSARLGVSNVTYRRWLKRPPGDEIPKEYERSITGGIYQLLAEARLSHDSKTVRVFLESHMPEFFASAIGQFRIPKELIGGRFSHQEKITSVLLQIGSYDQARRRVAQKANWSQILKHRNLGDTWREWITALIKIVRSKKLPLVDKFIAYGALFYLVLSADVIPDSVPIFGYVDDFGILGFAAAHYRKNSSAKTK